MQTVPETGAAVRRAWLARVRAIAGPPLHSLARRTFRRDFPVESSGTERERYTHLEAFGRLISGIAPWLEAPAPMDAEEAQTRDAFADLARGALASIADPASPDFGNFSEGQQPVVDAAFLALGLLRAPTALVQRSDPSVREHLAAAFVSSRRIAPHYNNWLLFSAIVEAALHRLGHAFDRMRVDYALRKHLEWYVGDGHYGDGPQFHWDYYNSYVIQPMMIAVLDELSRESDQWKQMEPVVHDRARRYAGIQERLVAPDGTFPAVGRSLAYRCGAFHHLADAALRGLLPEAVLPAQVRGALNAVISRTLDPPGTTDADGWLRIGLAGSQPSIGETYISTGSLYLCLNAFLPLGLSASDPFWTGAPLPWTARRVWGGENTPADHAL